MKKYLPICIILILSITFISLHNIGVKEELNLNSTKEENDNKFTIAAYINGVFSDTMPTESKYFGYVECRDNSGNKLDTLGFVEWENDKWNVRITDITKASTCNVYFIDPPAHWLDAEEGTLLKAIKDNNKVENTKTIPGKQINKEDEAILSGTLDDYGTSYYFRGNVQNNYVVFNNMCWKIVRITGNGSIKLILHNERGIGCEVPNNLYNYARYDGTNTSTPFNELEEVANNASGGGFMYGDINAQNFTDAQANTTASTILTRLQDWYDLKFTDNNIIDNLSDVIWCGDKSLSSGNGWGNTYLNYGTLLRLKANRNPSLICPEYDTINGYLGKLSKYTSESEEGNALLYKNIDYIKKLYFIGLLNGDEISFAGIIFDNGNNKNFLYNDSYYWTMTPYALSNGEGYGIIVGPNGNLSSALIKNAYNLRPSIALNYNVQATYNKTSQYEPGTINNPYIIN